ncbi:uncharacterized protein C8Q71DRAFT_721999 [Rhodofomes roseus]|uniref:Uncharacterized protein n=1 Tax=Rhodofomes roseus TaxID=34475 RepID=A0ABQ8KRF4_9APHY|nr:uncharacterized protein C8Q71DRAFT_721999 [Rhodofomes roseus]KAH9840305.1 hypothetical protein C8Q71DRAFT_721999 [Rhodofomes roseus]
MFESLPSSAPVSSRTDPVGWWYAREIGSFLQKRGAWIAQLEERVVGNWAALSSEGEQDSDVVATDTERNSVGMAHGLRTESTTYERVRARNGTAIRRKASPRSTDLGNTTRTGQIHSN